MTVREVTFSWSAPNHDPVGPGEAPPAQPDGFRIFYGLAEIADVGPDVTEHTLNMDLGPGEHEFFIEAYSTVGGPSANRTKAVGMVMDAPADVEGFEVVISGLAHSGDTGDRGEVAATVSKVVDEFGTIGVGVSDDPNGVFFDHAAKASFTASHKWWVARVGHALISIIPEAGGRWRGDYEVGAPSGTYEWDWATDGPAPNSGTKTVVVP